MAYLDYLQHWGILGMHWGERNGPPYPLSSSQMSRSEKKDAKWAKKNYNKIYKKAYKSSAKEIKSVVKELDSTVQKYTSRGKISAAYANAYNKKVAVIMSSKVSDLQAPSGKVVQFVAKRGEVGVHMALADVGYDMSQLKNGVYSSGRIAYKKKVVDKV